MTNNNCLGSLAMADFNAHKCIEVLRATKKLTGKQCNNSWKDAKQNFLYAIVDAKLKAVFTETKILQIGAQNYTNLFDQATK